MSPKESCFEVHVGKQMKLLERLCPIECRTTLLRPSRHSSKGKRKRPHGFGNCIYFTRILLLISLIHIRRLNLHLHVFSRSDGSVFRWSASRVE